MSFEAGDESAANQFNENQKEGDPWSSIFAMVVGGCFRF
jgi:hypothetical protein